jgi:Tfp pilus assembly protein PilN
MTRMAFDIRIPNDVRRLLAFGSGVGIEIGPASLEVVAARVRPSRINVLGRLEIANFAARPAAEWGAEYSRFLNSLGVGRLSAAVLLPRREVIVRQLALPGVAARDTEGAIRFQMDSLHPYGDEAICWGWSPLAFGAVLVGVVRRATVDRYVQLFTEAGIAVSAFTFSAAAVHAAIQLNGGAGASHAGGFVALSRSATGDVEVYGESPAHPVFSAEFSLPPERAAALALSELRLPPETEPVDLERVLPAPAVNPVDHDLSRNALPYATALAGACPRVAPSANLLPAEYRKFNSRAVFVPALALAAVLLATAAAMAISARVGERRYLDRLNAEISSLEPKAQRAAAAEREISRVRARTQLLDRFRNQTRNDLDSLKELTRLVEPPAWTNNIDLSRDTARLSGEAPQAAPLLKILDSSPLFKNSVLDMAPRGGTGELFQIHASRENTK